MKGNIMLRLLALMILVPVALAHFGGQIDLTQPSWLWLTILAGLNALQATFTGFCPPRGFFGKDKNSGTCCATDTTSTCCTTVADEDIQKSTGSCCSAPQSTAETKSSSCCSSTAETSADVPCCAPEADTKVEKTGCCSAPQSTAESKSASCCGSTPETAANSTCCANGADCLEIKVLGTGCQSCTTTMKLIENTAAELNVLCCVTKVEDIVEIAEFGVMATPGVVINGQVVHSGSIPTKAQVIEWLAGPSKGCCG